MCYHTHTGLNQHQLFMACSCWFNSPSSQMKKEAHREARQAWGHSQEFSTATSIISWLGPSNNREVVLAPCHLFYFAIKSSPLFLSCPCRLPVFCCRECLPAFDVSRRHAVDVPQRQQLTKPFLLHSSSASPSPSPPFFLQEQLGNVPRAEVSPGSHQPLTWGDLRQADCPIWGSASPSVHRV